MIKDENEKTIIKYIIYNIRSITIKDLLLININKLILFNIISKIRFIYFK